MGQLYGRSPERAAALRTFTNGKMKTSIVNGSQYPPLLADIQQEFPDFSMNIPANLQIDTTRNATSTRSFYALGDPRFNLHLGHLFWSTQFLRLHNRMCDMLLQSDPTLSDAQVYETSRLVLFHFHLKLIVHNYIGGTISNFRGQAGIVYDPDVMRNLEYPTGYNFIHFELNHLYRWHSMIPDELDLAGGTPFPDVVFQPGLLTKAPLESLTQAFVNTTAGALAAVNTPDYIYPLTRQTILDSRAQHLQGFNAYRAVFGLESFTSFEDFGLSPQLTATMQELYSNDIDSVDWFVGVTIEQPHLENTFLGEAMYVSVATFALSAILNSDMIKNPELWSEDRMTAAGRAFVESNDMSSFLQLDLPNPFFTPDKQPTWHTIASPSGWRFQNLEKFVGLDFALDPFFSGSDYFYVLFYVALGAAAVVIIAFCLVSLVWHGLHSRTALSLRAMHS